MSTNVATGSTLSTEFEIRPRLLGPSNNWVYREELLIEQIGMCWLMMYETQQRYANARASTTSMNIAQAQWLEKRLSIVQERYLKSIEMLAKVRKLAKPSVGHTLMLNMAKQQINAALRG